MAAGKSRPLAHTPSRRIERLQPALKWQLACQIVTAAAAAILLRPFPSRLASPLLCLTSAHSIPFALALFAREEMAARSRTHSASEASNRTGGCGQTSLFAEGSSWMFEPPTSRVLALETRCEQHCSKAATGRPAPRSSQTWQRRDRRLVNHPITSGASGVLEPWGSARAHRVVYLDIRSFVRPPTRPPTCLPLIQQIGRAGG